MKSLLLISLLLPLFALAAEPDVKLSLGEPRFKPTPEFGGGLFELVATVSNSSKETIWLRTLKPDGVLPYYHAAVRRSKGDEWQDIMTMGSGLGMNHFKLAPGKSLSFSAQVLDKPRHEYRAQMFIYPTKRDAEPILISSGIMKLPDSPR